MHRWLLLLEQGGSIGEMRMACLPLVNINWQTVMNLTKALKPGQTRAKIPININTLVYLIEYWTKHD